MDPIDCFLDWFEHEREARPLSVVKYRRELRALALRPEMTSDELTEALNARTAHLAPATRSSIVGICRAFFAWASDTGLATENVALNLRGPALKREVREPPSRMAIARMLDSYDPLAPHELRDRAMVSVMYGTGARVGELRALTIGDVDLDERRLVVRSGKGGKSRHLPIPHGTTEHLRQWIGRRGDLPGPMWLTYLGTTPSHQHIMVSMRRRAERLGLDPKQWHPHALRRAFATHLMEEGVSMRQISRMLGHTDSKVTEAYLHVCIAQLARAVDAHHPLGRKAVRGRRVQLVGRSTLPWAAFMAW